MAVALPTGSAAVFYDFGQAWKDAADYVEKQHEAWNEIWTAMGVPADVAEAIVFPEMLRYSALQDQIETTVVSGTYVTLGSKGFDFSVGRFQMKPSFVERLEQRWMRSGFPSKYELYFDTADNRNARRVRLSRVSDELWQCIYVAAFIKLTYLDFQGLADLPVNEQVRLIATAYNRGIISSVSGGGNIAALRSLAYKQTFYTVLIPTKDTPRYCYADIALQYYDKS